MHTDATYGGHAFGQGLLYASLIRHLEVTFGGRAAVAGNAFPATHEPSGPVFVRSEPASWEYLQSWPSRIQLFLALAAGPWRGSGPSIALDLRSVKLGATVAN